MPPRFPFHWGWRSRLIEGILYRTFFKKRSVSLDNICESVDLLNKMRLCSECIYSHAAFQHFQSVARINCWDTYLYVSCFTLLQVWRGGGDNVGNVSLLNLKEQLIIFITDFAFGMQIICFHDRLQVVMRVVEWSLDCWKQSVSQQLGSIQ